MNILIVEDDSVERSRLEEYIRSCGHEVTACTNAETALEVCQQTFYPLIIVDLNLPGMDGLALCRRIRSLPQEIHSMILVITGRDEPEDLQAALDAGADDYLVKPANRNILQVRLTIIEQQFRDRTRRKQTEDKIRQQHEFLNHVLESLPHPFYVIDPNDYTIIMANSAATFGVLSENSTCYALTHRRDTPCEGTEHPCPVKELKEHKKPFTVEHIHYDQAGNARHVEVYAYPIFDRDGNVVQIIEYSLDITERKQAEQELRTYRSTIKDRYKFGEIIGKSPVMQEIYELVASASASDAHVTLSGESGTGKELIARTIHQLSDRHKQAFVPVSCGAIPESLFESEFFGYRKGAFTGADRNKEGFFDRAHHGTLFLDEVGELSPLLQVKLLRAIDRGEYMPLGSNTLKTVDVRIVAATNKDLEEQLRQGLMREDFFYRIQVISIKVPPLRERKGDIPLLIDFFLKQYNKDGAHPTLPGRIAEALYMYDWPSNIRQLQNVLQRYLTVKRLDFLGPGSPMPAEVQDIANSEAIRQSLTLQDAIEVFEKQFLIKILEQHHWQKNRTAQALGIERRTLYRKMKKFGIG